MRKKEIIRRILRHDAPPRVGFDYIDPKYQDILHVSAIEFVPMWEKAYQKWGMHEALSKRSGFHGETRYDAFGNIYGRFEGKTKGECVYGILQEGWEGLSALALPEIDRAAIERVRAMNLQAAEQYALASLPTSVFSILRDVRKMEQALMDTLLEEDCVRALLDLVVKKAHEAILLCAACGIDGLIMFDDWGTQHSPFISPDSFAALFKPAYAAIAEACHAHDLDFILHSCGFVQPLVDHMIEAGIDAFQFDQPELSGSAYWAQNYGDKAAFYSPVDIQKVLPTGDRALIEETALSMVSVFKQFGGSLIGKDYGGLSSLADINVKPEWAGWAMDVIVKNAWL